MQYSRYIKIYNSSTNPSADSSTRKLSFEVTPITVATFPPVTVMFILDLDSVKVNQHDEQNQPAKYLRQRSFRSIALLGPLINDSIMQLTHYTHENG